MSDEAPLPPGWKQLVSKSRGCIYYFNESTGKSSWERPRADPGLADSHRTEELPDERAAVSESSGAVQHESKRPRLSDVIPLAVFNASRQQLLSDGLFLDIAALEYAVRRHFGDRLPHEVSEALGGLQRVMASVNSALAAAFATHHLLTLRDLEAWVLWSSRDFEGAASFAELCLGPLGLHPLVLRHMPHAHVILLRSPHLKDLDAISVVSRVANLVDANAQRVSFGEGLHLFAQELGLENASELPVHVRAEGFLSSLVERCLNQRRHVEHVAAQQAEREAAHAAQQAARERADAARRAAAAAPPLAVFGGPDAPDCVTELLATVEYAAADAFLAAKDRSKSRLEIGLLKQERAATREVLGRMRTAPNAMEATRELLRGLHTSWSQHAVLCWSLPRIATLTLPLSDAKQLLHRHAEGEGDVPLDFPPIFNNEARKELHHLCQRHGQKIHNYSVGEGARRYLVVHRSELIPNPHYHSELDDRFEGAKPALTPEEVPAQAGRAAVRLLTRAGRGGNEAEEEEEEGGERGGGTKLHRPDTKWLSDGERPTYAKMPSVPPGGKMPSNLALHLIGKEVVAPLVRKLVYAAGCLAAVDHSSGATDGGRRADKARLAAEVERQFKAGTLKWMKLEDETEGMDLRSYCQTHGLGVSGEKAEVVARIVAFLSDAAEVSAARVADEDADGNEGSAAQQEYRVLRVLDHVRTLVEDDENEAAQDAAAATASSAAAGTLAKSPIDRLATLEARLLRENDMRRFEELKLPHRSLLALLAAEAPPALQLQLLPSADATAKDVSAVRHGRHWTPSTLLPAASRLLAQLSAASPDASPEQLYAALAAHYGAEELCAVASVGGSAGGVEGARHVIDSLRRAGSASDSSPAATSPSSIMPACMLAMPFVVADQTSSWPALPSAAAVAAILAVPPLADLESTTRWPLLFEPSVGSLRQFCASTPSVASLVLELCDGLLIKMQAGTLSDMSSALHALEATRAVALALYLCSSGGGSQHAPLELIRSEVSAALAAAPSTSALAFSLGCVDALPAAKCPPALLRLVASLFLTPLKAVLPGAYRSLVAMADACQQPLLGHIGCMLGETELVSAGLPSSREAAPADAVMKEQQPATKAAVAATAAASSSIVEGASAGAACSGAAASMDAAAPVGVTTSLQTSDAPPTASVAEDPSEGDDPSCEDVCKAIARRFGCGIDAELDAAGQEALQQLRGVTMRSIQRLAAELYGGNAHFLLEIIQNADDNRYPARAVPQLCIRLPRDGCEVAFDNNELGFSARNVLALCSMGESTKQAADANSIGNKGIGFKSVFKVTPRPRVHSRHFHLQFDARDGGLGYIVPSPAAPPADWDSARKGTRLVLPLEEDGLTKLRELRVQLADLKPSLLLFLRRLRRLEIDDATSGVRRCITMRHTADDGTSVVALLEEQEERSIHSASGKDFEDAQQQQQRWLLVRKVLEPKVERLGIRRTHMVLAFPLLEQANGWLPPQDVCAFLPLRSYGLRFILQAGALPTPPPVQLMPPLSCPFLSRSSVSCPLTRIGV